MNICLFNRLFQQSAGGIETYTYRMACEYAKRGHKVHIVTTPGARTFSFNGLQENIKIHEFNFETPSFRGFWRIDRYFPLNEYAYNREATKFFSDIIRRENIEVVEIPEFDGFVPGKNRPYAVVVRLHGFHGMVEKFSASYYRKRPGQYLYKHMVRQLCNSAEIVSAVSQNFADLTKDVVGISGHNLTINYLGVDRTRFKLPDRDERSSNTVLFVGRLDHSKGLDTIMGAIPRVCKEIPDIKFVFVGRDTVHKTTGRSYVDMLKDVCPEQNLDIKGVLSQDEVVKHYQSATVAVFPSHFEPGGTVAIEAMACGCPTITTSVGGFREYYQHKTNGMVMEPGNSNELADHIIKVIEDEKLQKTIQHNALKLIDQKLNLELIVDKSLDIYQQAINKHQKSKNSAGVI